ncbi:hypothetical protein [Rhizobium leguminosarum]
MTDTPEQTRVEQLAEYLCSEFDFSLDPCVGYSWPEHPNDEGYRGDGNWVKLQPSDVQAFARENAERILAFLSTSKPVAEAVKVKPLEWNAPDSWNLANTVLGTYVVRPCLATNFTGQFLMCRPGDEDSVLFPSEDAAKAAAQADYEQRILSALESKP